MKNKIIIKNKNIAGRIIDKNAFVVVPHKSTLYQFNETGTHIWQILDKENIMFEDIVKSVRHEFDVSLKESRKDTAEFIDILKEKKLIYFR